MNETAVPALLLRHASAGSRKRWTGEDRERPLDDRGQRQAEALAAALAQYPIARILSSPYVRCVQTVEPLAARLGLVVEPVDDLAEGASPPSVAELLRQSAGETVVLCTHGDVIEDIVGLDAPNAKGSYWVLSRNGQAVRPERYTPPPDAAR